MENQLSPQLSGIANTVRLFAEDKQNASEKQDLVSSAERLESLALEIEQWRTQDIEDGVFWVESSTNRWGRQLVKLCASPIDIGPVMRQELFNKTDTCILASATSGGRWSVI